jgi:AraC-like DNA-binding protein
LNSTTPPVRTTTSRLFARPPEQFAVRFAGVTLHIFLEPGVVERVAAEAFELNPARVSIIPLDGVHLIRIASALRSPPRRTDAALPREKLHAVIKYIDENLDTDLTLAQMAAAAHLSAYHFARQFKAATGLPPHQYVVTRRVERAQQLLRKSDLSLADVAASAGF